MIQTNVSMEEMALACGFLAQMAKDFSESTAENEDEKNAMKEIPEAFLAASHHIVVILGSRLGGQKGALALIQKVMAEYEALPDAKTEATEG